MLAGLDRGKRGAMKRDMNLIRTILLKVEADQTLSGSFQAVNAATFGITDHTDNLSFGDAG